MWGEPLHPLHHGKDWAFTRIVSDDGYIIGVDNPFLNLQKHLAQTKGLSRITVDDIDFNPIFRVGLFGSTHIVDCMSTDPAGYKFATYGPKIGILTNKNYHGRYLADAEWPVIGQLAMRDYSRVKHRRVSELTQVEISLGPRKSVYRRLTMPLFGDRGEISHVLVATVPDLIQIVPSSFHNEITRR